MRRQSAALRHARCTQECAQRSLSPSRAHSSNAGLERFPRATAEARRAAHLGPAAVDSDVHANRRHPRARAAPRHPRNPHPNASPRRRATRAACAQAPHPPAAQAAFALRLILNPEMYIQYFNLIPNPNPICAAAAGRRACSTEGFAPQTTPPASSGACTNTQRQWGQPRPRHHSIHFSVTHCAQARSRSHPRHHATSLPSQMSGKHERSCACTPFMSDAAMASARRRSGNRGMPCAGDLWGGGCAGARVDERALSAPAPHTWHAVPSTASAAYNAS